MAFVIIGLGNTGKEYEKTRHNAGRMVVELIAKKHDFPAFVLNKTAKALVSNGVIDGEKVTLVLPETMMNLSGKSAMAFVKSPKAAKNLLVIQDELDLPLGTLKMVFDRGSGGHKGVESVMRAIKTKAFTRLRVGISGAGKKHQAKKPSGEEKVVKHVIGKFKPTEEAVLKKSIARAAEASRLFVTEGIEKATMEANTR
ncbi:MAG TPA: aminoacyl-tRNA hydrolase [Candidatus Paceibacterota bacterium]|nr:aminoacyl-tRNA hydrolase [Candidatus Paceibacterota bacterium]